MEQHIINCHTLICGDISNLSVETDLADDSMYQVLEQAGTAGLLTKANSVTAFDDFAWGTL